MLRLCRPRQWAKNVLVFAALLFSGRFVQIQAIGSSLLAFVALCAASSAVYALNDAIDAPKDRLHPRKRRRPVASGVVSVRQAITLSAVLGLAALAGALAMSPFLGLIVATYLAVNIAYCFGVKNMVLLDVMTLASGFVLRAVAGAAAIHAVISEWFLVCVLLLSLLIAIAKRRSEVASIGQAAEHRAVLEEYPVLLLDQLIGIVSGASLVSYLLYAMDPSRPRFFAITIPFAIYGIFRYLYLVYRRGEGGSPEDTLLMDRPIMITVALWACSCALAIFLR